MIHPLTVGSIKIMSQNIYKMTQKLKMCDTKIINFILKNDTKLKMQ